MGFMMNVFFTTMIALSTSKVLSVAVPKAFSTPSPECIRKCSSCPATPVCPAGISLVLDDCGCCKTCARQLGETCGQNMKCDPHKNLYCSYSDFDESENFCAALPGRACYAGGVTYVNGESFDIGCKVTCTCIDGYLGCVPKCPITINALPPKNCLHPKMVVKPGQCCQEWVCASENLNNTTSANHLPSPLSFIRKIATQTQQHLFASANRQHPISISIRPKDKCKIQSTEWSPCSKTCGWGVSERVTTDNKACKFRKESRLCQLRPCNTDFRSSIKRGKKCTRIVKAQRKVRFTFSSCHSKVYTPKYCGTCTDDRCCAPKHTVTKAIKFTCDDGFRFKKRMMIIKSCECNWNCPNSSNDIFRPFRRLSSDTWE